MSARSGLIKCVVWDLDKTIWTGTLAEGDSVKPRPGIEEAIRELDSRGILQSVASRNRFEDGIHALESLGLREFFLYPQIGWVEKSKSIVRLTELLKIGMGEIAIVDDEPYERDEVRSVCPQVECFDGSDPKALLDHPRLNPSVVSEDSAKRRLMYMAETKRQTDEENFSGPRSEFLAGLHMKLHVSPAGMSDLNRSAELIIRTHQLNTTGIIFSPQQLELLSRDPNHLLYITRLDDRYGTYGTIGLFLAALERQCLVVRLFLLSCRVLSRGIGTTLLLYIMNLARRHNLKLEAEFIPNERNRIMHVTLRFAGFDEIGRRGNVIVFGRDLSSIPPYPDYLEVCS